MLRTQPVCRRGRRSERPVEYQRQVCECADRTLSSGCVEEMSEMSDVFVKRRVGNVEALCLSCFIEAGDRERINTSMGYVR